MAAAIERDGAGQLVPVDVNLRCRSIREEGRKVSADFVLRGHERQLRAALNDAKAFVIHEEKCLVVNDWAAECRPELILVIGLTAEQVESVGRVEGIIAKELVCVAVKLVGAGLDDGVENGAVATAKFRAVRVGLNFELLDRIDRRLDDVGLARENVTEVGVVVNAVEQEIVLQGACAVGAETVAGGNA